MRKVGDTGPGLSAPGATVKAPRPDAPAPPAATRVTGSAPRSAPQIAAAAAPGGSGPKATPAGSAPKINPALLVPPPPPPSIAKPTTPATSASAGKAAAAPRQSQRGLWALVAGVAALLGVIAWIQLSTIAEQSEVDSIPRATERGMQAVVTLSIDTYPPGAQVWVDDTALGSAPVSLAVAKGTEPVNYVARMSGYGDTFGSFEPTEDRRLLLTLNPLQPGAPAQVVPPVQSAPPGAADGSGAHPTRHHSRSRGTRAYEPPPPPPSSAPAPRSQPSGDPFRRFD
jgi:hypothetical protein